MYLLGRDIAAIRAVIKALHVRRNRHGAIDCNTNDLDLLCLTYPIPHGGYDAVDKACMILQAIIGDKPISILDDGSDLKGRP